MQLKKTLSAFFSNDVVKVLGSVRQMVEAGNRVVFDKSGSYIEHKLSKKRTHMKEKGGGYTFSMQVKKQGTSGFQRQASLVQAWNQDQY